MVLKKRLQAGYYEHDEFGSKSIGVEVKLIDRQPYISSSTQSNQDKEERNDDNDTIHTDTSSISSSKDKVNVEITDANDVTTISEVSESATKEEDDDYKYNLKIVNSLDVTEYKRLKKLSYEHKQQEKEESGDNASLIQKITNSMGNLYNKNVASFQAGDFDEISTASGASGASGASKSKSKKKIRRIKKVNPKDVKEVKSDKKNRPIPPSYEEIESQLLQQALASGGVLDICYNNKPRTITPHFDMRSWLASQYIAEQQSEENTVSSSSLIVHEIRRGNWTWCLAWSPDGKRLALASENHHLAIVDTSSSSVWKIIHDKRIKYANDDAQLLHSIRSIAWGHTYIAVGGTGDTVSILDPNTYLILHTIQNTGFVGCLTWKPKKSFKNGHNTTTTVAIGTRDNNLCLIVDITFKENGGSYESKIIHSVERKDWVNGVSFSPSGTMIAIGDRAGRVSVYVYLDGGPTSLQVVKEFKFSAAVLAVEWSACGQFLYVGGENFKASFIKTNTWTIVHEIQRNQWVQFLSPSHTGLNVAIGGGENELSIIDSGSKDNETHNYINIKNIHFGAPVLLVSKWHPSDQYLAIGGQDSNVIVVETTNVRYVENSFLKLENVGISCIQLSPSGQILVIARNDGVVTFMDTTASDSTSSFIVLYEIVLGTFTDVSNTATDIEWSPDGAIVAIGSGDAVVVISTNPSMYLKNPGYKNSRFSLVKVIRGMKCVESISFSPGSNIMAVTGPITKVFDAGAKFACIHDIKIHGLSSAWSDDGKLLAFLTKDKSLVIYSTATSVVYQWKKIFEIKCQGTSLAWAPTSDYDIKYLAYGGENKTVTIIEIRAIEESWEMVLEIPRKANVNDLDWSSSGMLAIATSNGTATIVDLSYLLTGTSVIEMDYNWQRQGITCLTEIQRKQNKNKMKSLHWLGPKATDGNVLALAGSDGIFELIDMTERERIDEYFESLYYNDSFSCARGKSIPSSLASSSIIPSIPIVSTIDCARDDDLEELKRSNHEPSHHRRRSGSINERLTHL